MNLKPLSLTVSVNTDKVIGMIDKLVFIEKDKGRSDEFMKGYKHAVHEVIAHCLEYRNEQGTV